MARSKIIKDLVNNNKSITMSLQELLVITNELDNRELNNWIKNELNGYANTEDMPEYRKGLPYVIVYSGINGRFNVTNKPLPLPAFGEHAKDISSLAFIKNSILELENLKEGTMQRDLTLYAGIVEENTGISCLSISMRFGKNLSDSIISNVKTKMIEALLLLEKEFGCLDDLYIQDNRLTGDKIDKVNKGINSIIFSDGGTY